MPGIHRLLILAATAMVVAGCGKLRKPEIPVQVAVAPKPIVIERRIYVPIPATLTRTEPVAEGPIAQCFEVAAQRRAAQERLNSRLRRVAEIQGTEVQP